MSIHYLQDKYLLSVQWQVVRQLNQQLPSASRNLNITSLERMRKYIKWRLQRELERKKIVKKFRMNQIAMCGQGSCLTDTCSTNWLLPLSFVSFTCLSVFPKRLIMMASAPKPKNSKCCFKKDFRTYNIEHIWTFNIFRKGFSVN